MKMKCASTVKKDIVIALIILGIYENSILTIGKKLECPLNAQNVIMKMRINK
jgi:hypothetical protein